MQREVNLMNNKHASIELIDEMAKVKDDFKILPSIIGVFEISRGTVAASLLSAREILIRILIVGATHFLICHNHPSGHLQPSKYDVDSTKNIVNAGRTIGIPLVDHLIIGDGRYVSLLEEYGKELFG